MRRVRSSDQQPRSILSTCEKSSTGSSDSRWPGGATSVAGAVAVGGVVGGVVGDVAAGGATFGGVAAGGVFGGASPIPIPLSA